MNSKLQSAKVSVVLDQPFFGVLICNLKFQEDPTCQTAWTDGTRLGYNPAYIDSLTHAEIVGLLCHEVLHCAGGHPFRRDGRDPKKWNYACDYAINPIVGESGMVLPSGSLECPSDMLGKSAEYIYDRLPDMPQDGQGDGTGEGQGQGASAPGEVRDSPGGRSDDKDGADSETPTKSDGEWQEITRQAAVQAKAQGQCPASMDRFATAAAQSKIDWKSALRKFVEQAAKADYSWSHPSRRYASMGLYLPGLHSESCPGIAIGVDTSGSMDDIALAKAKAEVIAVMDEVQPDFVEIMYADARVARVDRFERGEEIVFQPAGGGGTDFRPVFEHVDGMEEKPACIIYITDLYGSFPEGSDIPTLWVTDTDQSAPFGDTLKIE